MRGLLALLLALGLAPAAAAAAAPLDRGALTRCLAGAVASGGAGRECLTILRAPCGGAGARGDAAYAACAEALAEGFARAARGLLAARAPFASTAERGALRAALARALREGRRRCSGADERDGAVAAARRAECRLLRAALIAHLVEFHPRRLIGRLPEDA